MSYSTNIGSNATKEEISDAINFLLANLGTNALTAYKSLPKLAVSGIVMAKSSVVVTVGATTSSNNLEVFSSDGTSNAMRPPLGTYKCLGGIGNNFALWARVT